MAKAPKPGSTPTARKTKPKGPRGFRITIRGEASDIYPQDVGPRDEALVRRETAKPDAFGYPVTLLTAISQLESEEAMGLDSLSTLWWWGRVKAGLTTESLAEALDRFPPLGDLTDPKVCKVEAITETAASEAADTDPLPSGDDSPPSSPA